MRSLASALLAASVCVSLPASAGAMDWRVQQDRSKIGFSYEIDGRAAKGVFGRFNGAGQFDAGHIEASHLTLRIHTKSIDLFDPMASAFATSAEWFDSKNHPSAIYELRSLRTLGGSRYEAVGSLTIRGRTKVVRTEIDLTINSDGAMARGSLRVVRADYRLGSGPSAALVEVGPEVFVTFELSARPLG